MFWRNTTCSIEHIVFELDNRLPPFLYFGIPLVFVSTRPAKIDKNHGIVSNIIVLPANPPMPTFNCSCAPGPKPLNNTIAPSGTAPKIGKTIDQLIVIYIPVSIATIHYRQILDLTLDIKLLHKI